MFSTSYRIAKLHAKHRAKYRVPFPDLSLNNPATLSATTAGFGPTPARPKHGPVPGLIVGHLHKQGMQVIDREAVHMMGRKT